MKTLIVLALLAASSSVPPTAERLHSHAVLVQDGPKSVNARQADQLIKETPGVVVLDVRTPSEFASGHIKGAVNVDYKSTDFEKQLTKLDKNKTYVVHCAVGGRSTHSLPVLQKLGFRNVRHLDGGLKAWEKAGLPLEK